MPSEIELLKKEIKNLKKSHTQLMQYLKMIHKMRERVTSAVDLQEVLDEINQALVDYFGAAFARIWLYDADSGELKLNSSRGMYTRIDGSRSIIKVGTFTRGKLQKIALEKKPHYSNTIQEDKHSPIRDTGWARENGLISFAGYPLLLGEELVGIMVFFSREKLNEMILEVMSLYAHIASLATRDAQLIEEQKMLALTDPLTNLYNRRYLELYLEQIHKSSMRYNEPYALAMIDIDHFKKVNDTFGHRTGDEILIQLGQAIKKSIRDSDLLVRYGGEEFTIVLLRIDKVWAENIMERLRDHIEKDKFPSEEKVHTITVSIGFTIYYPLEMGYIETDDIINIADNALYKAKEKGRNRVIFQDLHGTGV